MNSIRDEAVALDTNVFIFALRRDPDHPACEILLFDKLDQLRVYMPLQVLIELQRKLLPDEMRGVLLALTKARVVKWDYAPARLDLVARWQERGAKKGDAVIAAHLEAAGVPYLISENRDFLIELTELPFEAFTAEKALRLLGE